MNKKQSLTYTKYVSYCRVSTIKQDEGTSLSDQERKCRDFATSHKMIFQKHFEEKASAMKAGTRKEFNKMVEYIKQNRIEVVVFAFIDRMSRNAIDADVLLKMVDEGKLKLVFVNEKLVLEKPIKPEERLLFEMLVSVSNFRVNQDKEKCNMGIVFRAEKGFRPNRPPYGYINDKKHDKAIIQKKRADFVKKAFELYATGKYTLRETSEALFEQGCKYDLQHSSMVPVQSLRHILTNNFYIGEYKIKQTGQITQGKHKAIIDKKTFKIVQQLMGNFASAPRKHNLLYSKLIECDSCKSPLIADVKEKSNGKRYVYYRCQNSKCKDKPTVTEAELDNSVQSYLKEIRLSMIPPDIVKSVLKEELLEYTQKLSSLKRDVSHKYDKERRFKEYISDLQIDDEAYLAAGLEEIQREYGDLDSRIHFREKSLKLIREKVSCELQNRLSDVYMNLDLEAKKQVLDLVTNTIKLKDNKLKITFKPAFRQIRKR